MYQTAPTNAAIEGKLSVNEGEELTLKCNYKEGNLPATFVDYKFDETFVKRLKPVSCCIQKIKRIFLTALIQ